MGGDRGFTLVELILTMIIVSTGLFGLTIVFDAANRGTIQGEVHQAALFLAQERLETVTADKSAFGYAYVTAANYPATEAVMLGAFPYTRLLAIQEVSPTDLATPVAGSGYKLVAVTVSWGLGALNQVNMDVVLSQY